MLEKIFNIGESVDGHVTDSYTCLAKYLSLSNYKIYGIGTLVKAGIKKGTDIPDYIYDFIGEQGEVLGIANIVLGEVFNIKFKSLTEKKFLTYGFKRVLPYGIGKLVDFKYGDPLVLVEGEKDRDCLSMIYSNVVATSTAGAGTFMKNILITLTNNFIVMYDNDDSGNKAFYRNRKFLVSEGCKVVRGIYPSGVKDVGILADTLYKGDLYNFEMYKSMFSSQMKVLTTKS